MVLEALDGGMARQMGMKTGDISLGISGMPTSRGSDLSYAIEWAPPLFEMLLLRDGTEQKLDGRFPPGPRMLGIILVPEGHETHYVTMSNESRGPLVKLYQRVMRFFRREK